MKSGIFVLVVLAVIVAVLLFLKNSTEDDRLPREGSVDRTDEPRAGAAESRTAEAATNSGAIRRDASAETGAGPKAIGVSVRYDDGAVAGDLRVVTLIASGPYEDARTDARGRFTVDGRFADGWVAACPLDARAHVQKLEVRSGTAEVIIPRGATVRGRLIVDDAEPGERVPMTWSWATSSESLVPIPQDISAIFAKVAGIDLRDRHRVVTMTQLDGTFAVHGLFAGETGKIAADLDREKSLWWNASQYTGLAIVDVVCPNDDVVVRATRGMIISGRVVREVDRSPIANAPIFHETRWTRPGGAGGSVGKQIEADRDGRFRIAVEKRVTEFVVTATDPASGTSKNIVISGPITESLDLGDLACPTMVPIDVTVVDPDGRPVEGACIAWSTPEWTPFVETAKDGTARLARLDDVTRLRIAKPGFRAALEDIGGTGPATVNVRLEKGTILRIRTAFENDAAPTPMNVNVMSDVTLFDTADGIADSAMSAAFNLDRARISRSGISRMLREFEAKDIRRSVLPEQTLDLNFLKPGVEFEVACSGGDFSARRRVVLHPGQTTELVFTIGQAPRRVFGRVVDPTGKPIADANLWINDGGGASTGAKTDGSGAFSTEVLFSECVDILVSHHRWASAYLKSIAVPKAGAIADIVLPEALTFILDIVDRHGAPVVGADVQPEGWTRAQEIEGRPGSFKIERCGPDPQILKIFVGGTTYPFSIDPKAGSGTMTIAASGQIDVTWIFELPDVRTTIVTAKNTNTSEADVIIVISPENRHAQGSATFKHLADGPWELEIGVRDAPNATYRKIGVSKTVEVKGGSTERVTISRE